MLHLNNHYELVWTQRYENVERICHLVSTANAWTETRKCKEEYHQLPSLTNVHETNDRTSQTEKMSMYVEMGLLFFGWVVLYQHSSWMIIEEE